MQWYGMGIFLMLTLYTAGSPLLLPIICADCYPACSCAAKTVMIDNGKDSHPRFVPNLECEDKKCFNRLLCRGIKYGLKILMPKSDVQSEPKKNQQFEPWERNVMNQHMIPDIFRPHYWVHEINITVACICSV